MKPQKYYRICGWCRLTRTFKTRKEADEFLKTGSWTKHKDFYLCPGCEGDYGQIFSEKKVTTDG